MRFVFFAGLLVAGSASGWCEVNFARDVQPIFASRCYACHSAKIHMNGLRLDQPGPFNESLKGKLAARISSTDRSYRMPPSGEPLTAKQIAAIKGWIGPPHWAFQPVRHLSPPPVRNQSWVRNPIDRFVLARIEKEGLSPSPEASRNTLIRRVTLDLTGLPPSPPEVAEFVADQRPDAYERLVDRLLASPHYGEKWARSWLDLAHYADSDGYEKDLTRPWAWRYRQWVIEALNRDMPFDQFTTEQLAGDLLPNSTVEQKVATGFLRTSLTNREAGVDRREARFDEVVTRTNTVGTVFLGLTVGCAQCHNHKFDPIPQKDYYRMLAFINSTEDVEVEAPLPGELGQYLLAKSEYDRKRREMLAEYDVPKLQVAWEARIQQAFREQGKDLEWDFAVTEMRAAFDGADKFLKGYWTNRTERQASDLTDYFIAHRGPDLDKEKNVVVGFNLARVRLADLKKTLPDFALADVVHTDPLAVETNVHLGGDYAALGDRVDAGTLSVLPALPAGAKADRLALARWIVSRENPLTARVAVNRMWQEFFGKGIVRSSEDFGTQGDRPTHPELLDWLASEFADRGWSMKQMHKLIAMSAAYRQSSATTKELDAKDPENTFIARQSRVRLPAEEIRDEALSVSALLNPAIGGRSVKPPQPAGVAELGYANNVKWVETTGPDKYRRGLYVFFQRTTPYPMLMNFDAPDSNTSCTRRRRSNTPLQSLNLLNDPVFFEAARALADRVARDEAGRSSQEQIDGIFALCLARKPNAREEQVLAQELARDGMLGVARVLLNLDEFITRE